VRTRALFLIAPLFCLLVWALAGGLAAGGQSLTKVYLPAAARNITLGDGSAATATPAGMSTATPTVSTPAATATPGSSSILTAWRINNSATSVALPGALTEVQSVQATAISGTPEVKLNSYGVPSYSQTMTSSVRATLVARPNASSDFRTGGAPSAAVGSTVHWGTDIGYNSQSCPSPTPGGGYWPSGPGCPSAQAKDVNFPTTPVPASVPSAVGGTIGYFVNGVAAYSYNDALTYNNQGVWYRTAADWEKYGMDIDNGHAAEGQYHHHFYPVTLAAQLGDAGNMHSPVYGFAADGYPIRGPYNSSGVLAQSGWQPRDYSAGSTTGCGTANKRTCLMVDQTNKNAGTTTATFSGPDVGSTSTAGTSVPVVTVSGVFAQDYYHDSPACTVAAACLDQYNGHEHDGLGYHYHITVTRASDGSLTPRFPYIVGLKFKGSLPANTFSRSRPGASAMWAATGALP
jgi:hypothetical protein